jgi:hypothetical protein
LIEEIEAFARDLAGRIHNHRPDQRAGTRLSGALRGQLERARHHLAVRFSPQFQSVFSAEVSTNGMSGWVPVNPRVDGPPAYAGGTDLIFVVWFRCPDFSGSCDSADKFAA